MLEQSTKLIEAEPPQNLDAVTRKRIRAAVDASFLRAFRIDMLAAAALAFLAGATALPIRSRRSSSV